MSIMLARVKELVSQKKVSTFENSWHQGYFTDLNDLNSI